MSEMEVYIDLSLSMAMLSPVENDNGKVASCYLCHLQVTQNVLKG